MYVSILLPIKYKFDMKNLTPNGTNQTIEVVTRPATNGSGTHTITCVDGKPIFGTLKPNAA